MADICGICSEPLDYRFQCSCTRKTTRVGDEANARKGCLKCGCTSATITEMSATGGILSRMLNLQYQRFDVVSCVACGYSEMYKRDPSATRDIVDLFFG
ncbi:zinc ribbon domain-containing protein [Brevibacillus reuszeri]|uniref:zinc ribbon domain-containing protein n=1 Tax=Brevibacillus reuszeri TaxID=54915 RepID=UPI000CCC3A48|nr:zinc ribbon domain-containing protein [Brevibacillus reuszeri]